MSSGGQEGGYLRRLDRKAGAAAGAAAGGAAAGTDARTEVTAEVVESLATRLERDGLRLFDAPMARLGVACGSHGSDTRCNESLDQGRANYKRGTKRR
jgi:hypothetical protein